jgi:hypothetical protein
MGIMEAVKKGFAAASKNLALVAVLIVFNLIWNLVSIPLAQQGAAAPTGLTAGVMLLSILFILISIFIQGGSLGLVRDYVKEGKAKIADMLQYGAKYYLRLLGIGLMIVLIIAVAGLVAALIVVATTPLNNAVVTAIAALVAVVLGAIGLYIVFLLIFSPYALVCDEAGVIESMKTSIRKVRKSLLKVLLLLVVLILIALGIGFLAGFITGLITAALPAATGQVIIAIVNSIFNGYLGVVMMAAFMVFYLTLASERKTI